MQSSFLDELMSQIVARGNLEKKFEEIKNMMLSEFIEKTGFEPTSEEYREIEEEYMGTEIDKDMFCRQWKKNGGPVRLMRRRARRIEELEDILKNKDRQYEEMDTKYCIRINQLQDDMRSKLNEASAANDQYKEELLRINRLYQEAVEAKDEAERKLDTVRQAFSLLI